MPATSKIDHIRYQAREEIAMKKMLDAEGCKAFSNTFQDLYGMEQLPGLAAQHLMAQGYGYGGEGDWKVSAMTAMGLTQWMSWQISRRRPPISTRLTTMAPPSFPSKTRRAGSFSFMPMPRWPALATGVECWITAGGAHHTVLSYDVTAGQMKDWCAMLDIEFVHITKSTTVELL